MSKRGGEVLSLDGKVALVTGAARGLGRAIALALAEDGADVALVDHCANLETSIVALADRTDLDEAVRAVEGHGVRAAGIVGDVTVASDMERAVAETVDAFGGLDVVVPNAGIWSVGCVWELTEQEWDEVMDVNLKGAWLTVKYALPHLVRQRSGAVVFVSSLNGLRAEPKYAHYIASKHGVIGLMKSVALEVGEYDINVNAVCPTYMKTPMVVAKEGADFIAGRGEDVESVVGAMNLLPGRGAIPPEEVASVVAWLVSREARHITGHAIPVDAGWIAKRGGA